MKQYIEWVIDHFFSTDCERCSQLHKWLTTYASDNAAKQSGVSRRGIEILKETPEVSALFYLEVEEEHNDAATIEENTLDETAAEESSDSQVIQVMMMKMTMMMKMRQQIVMEKIQNQI